MSNHIEKMENAIYANTGPHDKGIDVKSTANAAFDALIDAVPDLIWETDSESYAYGSFDMYGHTIEYELVSSDQKLDIWSIHCSLSCHDFGGSEVDRVIGRQKAKDTANEHNREQVRKIWKE